MIERTDLALVEGLGLNLPLLLQAVDNILVAPANLVRQSLDRAELPAGLQSQDTECLGHDHALLAIVWWGDALVELETLEGGCAAGGLVGRHTTDGAEEDFGRGAVMEGARLFRVDDMALVEEVVVPQLHTICISKTSNTFTIPVRHALLRKKLPEMLISSQRTTTIFWPDRICLEIMEASRPRR